MCRVLLLSLKVNLGSSPGIIFEPLWYQFSPRRRLTAAWFEVLTWSVTVCFWRAWIFTGLLMLALRIPAVLYYIIQAACMHITWCSYVATLSSTFDIKCYPSFSQKTATKKYQTVILYWILFRRSYCNLYTTRKVWPSISRIPPVCRREDKVLTV